MDKLFHNFMKVYNSQKIKYNKKLSNKKYQN